MFKILKNAATIAITLPLFAVTAPFMHGSGLAAAFGNFMGWVALAVLIGIVGFSFLLQLVGIPFLFTFFVVYGGLCLYLAFTGKD